jgi:hypothetical protein
MPLASAATRPALPKLPNSALCVHACLCADLHVHSQPWEQAGNGDDRQLSMVIRIQDTPIDYLCCARSGIGVASSTGQSILVPTG